jgi:hypothetical protein
MTFEGQHGSTELEQRPQCPLAASRQQHSVERGVQWRRGAPIDAGIEPAAQGTMTPIAAYLIAGRIVTPDPTSASQ